MKHVTLDAYGCTKPHINTLDFIYDCLTGLVNKLSLEPLAPVELIPYFYGAYKEDNGISAFVVLKGGHATIHAFPYRGCYFVDLLSYKNFEENDFLDYFKDVLPFDSSKSLFSSTNRDEHKESMEYSPHIDFGPHYMARIVPTLEVSPSNFYYFLEKLTKEINMDKITRARVYTDSTSKDFSFCSGIILIAQSHISIHYIKELNKIYADVFSCAPFDFSVLKDKFKILGNSEFDCLIPRGTKHINKLTSVDLEIIEKKDTNWRDNIREER